MKFKEKGGEYGHIVDLPQKPAQAQYLRQDYSDKIL